jgi:hypothetical protein
MSEPTPRRPLPGAVLVLGSMILVGGVVALVSLSGRPSGPPPPPEPDETEIELVTDPVGATIYLIGDAGVGEALGLGPMTLKRPRENKELFVVTRYPGYKERRSTIPLFSKSGRIDIELIKVGAPDPKPPKALPDGWTP